MRLKILLVDDHEVVRLGLKALLSNYPYFVVVAEASNADEAISKAVDFKPDVIVMDIRLPGKSGIEATREIMHKLPDTKVVIWSAEDCKQASKELYAHAFVSKLDTSPKRDLVRTVSHLLAA